MDIIVKYNPNTCISLVYSFGDWKIVKYVIYVRIFYHQEILFWKSSPFTDVLFLISTQIILTYIDIWHKCQKLYCLNKTNLSIKLLCGKLTKSKLIQWSMVIRTIRNIQGSNIWRSVRYGSGSKVPHNTNLVSTFRTTQPRFRRCFT